MSFFALDSIPAVLSITRDAFLAYTSNIMAVIGLRSLYFLLIGALSRLRFLHYGLAASARLRRAQDAALRWVEDRPSRLAHHRFPWPPACDHLGASLWVPIHRG